MNIKLRSILFALVLITAACKKDSSVDNAANQTVTNLVVPTAFHWETSRDVSFSIGISDTRFQNSLHVVAIYLSDPANGGTPISKGSASLVAPFNTKIALPSTLTEVYAVKTAPDGSAITQKIELTSNNISIALSSVAQSKSVSLNPVMATAETFTCGREVSSNSFEIAKGEVVCFNPKAFVSDATVLSITANQGGTLRINAPNKTVLVTGYNHTELNLIVTEGTTVIFSSNLEIKDKETVTNNGTVRFNNGLKIASNATLQNNGEVTVNNSFETSGSTSVVVNAKGRDFTATGETKLNGTFNNSGAAVFNILNLNGSATLFNYCSLTANSLRVDNLIKNYSLINVLGDTYVNGSGKIELNAGAMHKTLTLSNMDGTIEGIGSTSVFKTETSGANVNNNGGKITGAIEYCSKTVLKASHFSGAAVAACGIYYLAKDECNTIGNGTAPVVKADADGDGIIDLEDAYPNDNTKAFNSYSVNYTLGGSTIAFEDSWPLKGDYDLNDVVLNSKYLLVTNSSNVVVQINASYALKATGADYQNGTGIQFNLPAANAKLVSATAGAYLETKQDSVVVMLFDNSKLEQATGNTEPGKTLSPIKNYSVVINIINGPLLVNFGIGTYNPFIWNNTSGFGRGYETHMFGKSPTNLANQKLFGTLDDKSVAGKYYTTVNNLPWAIELPIANFGYMAEGKEITKGYTKFAEWANSGGKLYKDWYTNASYINAGFIFTK